MEQTEQESIQNLAKRVSELAELQTSHGSIPQGKLLEAIQRLQIAVEGPEHYVHKIRHQPAEYICVLLAIESGMLQALVGNGGKPLTVQEVAEKANADPLLTIRVMRILTALGIFDEVGPSLYKSNRTSEWLGQPAQANGFRVMSKWIFPIAGNVLSLWKNNQFTQFPEYSKGEKSPFVWAHSMNPWEMMRGDPDLRLAYDSYMPERRVNLRIPWHEIYPAGTELNVQGFQEPHEPPLLVDVGGNWGYEAAGFRKKNPHIKGRCVVQDLPETLASGPAPPEGIERIQYDFFTPQPIKGARAYLFKAVCHDFNDADCQRLLHNTVRAMSPGSALLIDDWVLPDVGAPLAGATEDIFMMLFLSGMERSESQWKAVLDSAGLEIKKIWRADGISEAVIEARKR